MPRYGGPVCSSDVGASWIDDGTNARTRNAPIGPTGANTGHQEEIKLPADLSGRLLLAAQCGLPLLPADVRKRLSPLLTYEGMAVLAGSVIAIGAAHAIGVGFAADILVGAVVVATIGQDVIEAAKHARTFYVSASGAASERDFQRAGQEFAAFVSLVGVNVLLVLLTKGRVRGQAPRPIINAGTTRAAWYTYINRIALNVPRDKGILWTKIGVRHAERLAESKGLVSLEMLLKEEGFYEAYAKQFGTFEDVRARDLQSVTGDIWKMLSERYASSLEGKVTAYVSQQGLSAALGSGKEPVLIDELWQISEVMEKNSRISHVELVDVSTGESRLMLRGQFLKQAGGSAH